MSRGRQVISLPVRVAAVAVMTALAMAGCSTPASTGSAPASTGSVPASTGSVPDSTGSASAVTASGSAGTPRLRVEVVTAGLEHGWDIGFLPDGKVLIAQRPGRFALVSSTAPGSTLSPVEADTSDIYVKGEGGLLGMVVHPDFATSREFTTCYNYAEGGVAVDVRLVTWRLSPDGARAEKVKNLLTGLPVAASGRHSGCRPTIAADGALIVGTGDTAQGSIPQDLTNLGGKTLRLDLKTGKPLPDNPFGNNIIPRQRYVLSYGHRNVQGVAIQPGTGQIFTAEHGPAVNDEVNRIAPGFNYGWDPSRGGTVSGYDESVPMTDSERFPSALAAIWQSGDQTEAICGAAFVSGAAWGKLDGALALTALKGAKLLFLSLDENALVSAVTVPTELDGAYGRLRAARLGPDGALYVTTTNGDDDRLLRIAPQAG